MKTLKNLNGEIKSLQGLSIAVLTGEGVLTIKGALVSICEMHQPKKPGAGEAIQAFDLGARLIAAKDSIDLGDTEIGFLKMLVENTTIFRSIVIGRLLKWLEEVKK